jgi:hypothetical protein
MTFAVVCMGEWMRIVNGGRLILEYSVVIRHGRRKQISSDITRV